VIPVRYELKFYILSRVRVTGRQGMDWKIEDEMGTACSTNGGEEECI
jgi:hypothetical protein